ncbi:MAG TPA: response regulator [Candidatus Nanoarchaeia archaeon]|nr:response regulator [Candidatus Nanoarchaeia archaeon]
MNQIRVLLVDDEPFMAVVDVLKDDPELNVTFEYNPRLAIRRIRSGLEYDVLVTDLAFHINPFQGYDDVSVEEMGVNHDGYLVTEVSRAIHPQTPIIITSAYSDQRLRLATKQVRSVTLISKMELSDIFMLNKRIKEVVMSTPPSPE